MSALPLSAIERAKPTARDILPSGGEIRTLGLPGKYPYGECVILVH